MTDGYKGANLAPRPALCTFITNKRIDDLYFHKIPILIQPYEQSPQTWHIGSKIALLVTQGRVDVYSIQRHSALITHHVLFTSQRAAFPILFSDLPCVSSTRIINISDVLNFAPKPLQGPALVSEGQEGRRRSPKAGGKPRRRSCPHSPNYMHRALAPSPTLTTLMARRARSLPVPCRAPRASAALRPRSPPRPR